MEKILLVQMRTMVPIITTMKVVIKVDGELPLDPLDWIGRKIVRGDKLPEVVNSTYVGFEVEKHEREDKILSEQVEEFIETTGSEFVKIEPYPQS